MRRLQERGPLASVAAPHRRRTRLVLVVAAIVIAVDQLTKWWAVEALDDGPIELVGPLRLALTTNTAGAFGLGGDLVPILAVGAVVLVIVLATRSDATRQADVAVAAGLVMGGALGNVVDRLVRSPGFLRGAVVDFVDVGFWPVFNVADAAITCGCILLVWSARDNPRSEGPLGPSAPRSEGPLGPSAPRSEGPLGPSGRE